MIIYEASWNAPTHRYFTWLTEGGYNIAELVTKSYDRVIATIDDHAAFDDPYLQMCEAMVCEMQQHLESKLLERFSLSDNRNGDAENGVIGDVAEEYEDDDEKARSLILPLLKHEVSEIEFGVVAFAILTQEGKWSPGELIPEVRECT